MPGLAPRTALPAFCLVLAVIGATYTALGIQRLVRDVPGSFPVDLRLRWIESRLLAEGRNNQRVGHPDPRIPDTHRIMRQAGGSYPPWSYVFGLAFVPPFGWTLVRYYYAGLSLAGLAAVSLFAWSRARPLGRYEAAAAALLPFTNFSTAICISYGQYAVVIAGLIAGALALLDHGKRWLPGLVLGLSLVKPQLGAPFFLALAAVRQWRTCAASAALVAAATVVMALLVGEGPSDVTANALAEMKHRRDSSNPLLDALSLVMRQRHAVLVLGLGSAAALAAIVARRRVEDWFRLACLSVIVAMFWTHRKHFDASLMSLPLAWMWIEAMRTKRRADLALFAVLAVSLWAPLRDTQWDLWWVQSAHALAWGLCGVRIYRRPTA